MRFGGNDSAPEAGVRSTLRELLESSDRRFQSDFSCDIESDQMLQIRFSRRILLVPNSYTLYAGSKGFLVFGKARLENSLSTVSNVARFKTESIAVYAIDELNEGISRNLILLARLNALGESSGDLRYGHFDYDPNRDVDANNRIGGQFVLSNGKIVLVWSGPSSRNWRMVMKCMLSNKLS